MAKIIGHYCSPHRSGVQPWMPPFYAPGCVTCEQKLAAGKITGQEPPPPNTRGRAAQKQWRIWMESHVAQIRAYRRSVGLPESSP
jgi:hypothetical protein